ncbi:MAG: polyphosphate polymerase domain-containing protein [Acidobacteriota bacterium]
MAGRIELKYLVDWRQRREILARWRPYLVQAPYTDERAVYPIMSLYFDTPSLLFYDEKLEGEALRNKVRLRGYGYRWPELSPVFLEIKRKVGPRIIKFRKKFDRFRPELFDPSQWGLGDEDNHSAQLASVLHRYRLRPAVQILYQREAYESPFVPSLRVAFDSCLVALHPGQQAEGWMFTHPSYLCLGETRYVFEIKSDGGLPEWVLEGIRAGQVTQRAISKYVLGIEKLDIQHREIGVYA